MKKISILLFCFALSGPKAFAQNNMLGFANSNYNGTNGLFLNPGSLADNRYSVYAGIYGFNFELANTYLEFDAPYSIWKLATNTGDVDFNTNFFKEVLNGRDKQGYFASEIRGPSVMFALGPKNALAFTTRVRAAVGLYDVPEHTIRLLANGLDTLQGELHNIPNIDTRFSLNGNAFAEIGLSFGRVLMENDKHFLKAGVTLKRFSALYSFFLRNNGIDYVVPNDDEVTITNPDFEYGYVDDQFYSDNPNYFNLMFNSPLGGGWGADFGLVYEFRPDADRYKLESNGKEVYDRTENKYKLKLGVSLLDVGSVALDNSEYVRYIKYDKQEEFDLKNLDESKITSFEDFEGFLKDTFNEPTESGSRIESGLPTSISIQADYQVAKNIFLNTTWLHSLRNNNKLGLRQNSLVAVTPRLELKRWLELAFPVSLTNDYQNFGLGAMLRLGPFYVGSDNLAGAFNIGKPRGMDVYTGLSIPIVARNKNGTTPVTRTFPPVADSKDRDDDGIKDKKDDCPDTPGLPVFNGCPDTDGDGIPDKDDECPQTPGTTEFNGCPDTDGDKIIDKNDACPQTPGSVEFNGCPDTDGDGLHDGDDKCPKIPGPKEFDGCPDRDRDGIIDDQDQCPDTPGIAQFNGCPDTDGDGIQDKNDSCPKLAGLAKFNGCPDTDADGIPDNTDECPNEPGPKQYQGCPDRDFDSVPDKVDKCPDNYGLVENEGCPLVATNDNNEVIVTTMEEQNIIRKAFDNLLFSTGKAVVAESSKSALDELALILRNKSEYRLLISGHTDSDGGNASNQRLSEQRSASVKTYLLSKSVSTDQLITEGFGEAVPVASNATKAGKAKNRRVELKIIK